MNKPGSTSPCEQCSINILEEFTAGVLQIIEKNKEKLPSYLLEEITMLTNTITTDVNVDESTKKTFICEKCGEVLRKTKVAFL